MLGDRDGRATPDGTAMRIGGYGSRMPLLRKHRGAFASVLLVLALSLASCGSSGNQHSATQSASAASSSAAATQQLAVAVRTPASEPSARGFWPIVVTAHTAGGAPVDGIVSYAFLFGGAVVARRPGGHMRGGVFHDRLEFPARAVGYPLTVQVIVRTPGAMGTTERQVTVHP